MSHNYISKKMRKKNEDIIPASSFIWVAFFWNPSRDLVFFGSPYPSASIKSTPPTGREDPSLNCKTVRDFFRLRKNFVICLVLFVFRKKSGDLFQTNKKSTVTQMVNLNEGRIYK